MYIIRLLKKREVEKFAKFDSEKKCFYKVLSQKKSYLITI